MRVRQCVRMMRYTAVRSKDGGTDRKNIRKTKIPCVSEMHLLKFCLTFGVHFTSGWIFILFPYNVRQSAVFLGAICRASVILPSLRARLVCSPPRAGSGRGSFFVFYRNKPFFRSGPARSSSDVAEQAIDIHSLGAEQTIREVYRVRIRIGIEPYLP